jgi:hypothetical protein
MASLLRNVLLSNLTLFIFSRVVMPTILLVGSLIMAIRVPFLVAIVYVNPTPFKNNPELDRKDSCFPYSYQIQLA